MGRLLMNPHVDSGVILNVSTGDSLYSIKDSEGVFLQVANLCSLFPHTYDGTTNRQPASIQQRLQAWYKDRRISLIYRILSWAENKMCGSKVAAEPACKGS
jgi:hypothetical protein